MSLDQFLSEVSSDAPCGPDLSEDIAALNLGQAATPDEDGRVDWDDVAEKALALLESSRDLRFAATLLRAKMATEGLAGCAEGLRFIRQLLDTFWDDLHPALDADGGGRSRQNAISFLNVVKEGIRDFRAMPLVTRANGETFSWRDALVATGVLPPRSGSEVDPAALKVALDSAFLEVPLEDVESRARWAREIREETEGILGVFRGRLAEKSELQLDRFLDELGKLETFLGECLERRGVGSEGGGESAVAGEVASAGAPAGPAASGPIQSREDAVRLMEKICEYFERHEPSSPVPLLIRRAQKLVSRDFLEVLRDLAPEGLAEANKVAGISDGE